MTSGAFEQYEAKHFSAVTKANLQDPKFNRNLLPLFQADPSNPQQGWQKYNEVQLAKQQEGDKLVQDLSSEAVAQWAEKLAPSGMVPPPIETVMRPGCPFVQVHPGYNRSDDIR